VKTSFQTTDFLNGLWLPALITCLMGIFFVLGFGLIYSHRISGPLFNLKRLLHKMSQGDLSAKMHIRATDEFHDVEDAFNLMAAELGRRHQRLRELLEALPENHRRAILKTYHELFSFSEGEGERVLEKTA